jgi:hypothetical protein
MVWGHNYLEEYVAKWKEKLAVALIGVPTP